MKSEDEAAPLNVEDGQTGLKYEERHRVHQSQSAGRLSWSFVLLLLIVTNILSISTTLYLNKRVNGSESNIPLPYSPANNHISYITRTFDDPESYRYAGSPRPELDQAWEELLEGSYIRVSSDELEQANNATSVPHKHGGFVAGIAAGHNLHCLKSIKQNFYPDYYPAVGVQSWAEREEHIDHCLETLRQALTCQVDYSLYTLELSPRKLIVNMPQPHKCVNWEVLHSWMRERKASGKDMIRPDFGTS